MLCTIFSGLLEQFMEAHTDRVHQQTGWFSVSTLRLYFRAWSQNSVKQLFALSFLFLPKTLTKDGEPAWIIPPALPPASAFINRYTGVWTWTDWELAPEIGCPTRHSVTLVLLKDAPCECSQTAASVASTSGSLWHFIYVTQHNLSPPERWAHLAHSRGGLAGPVILNSREIESEHQSDRSSPSFVGLGF